VELIGRGQTSCFCGISDGVKKKKRFKKREVQCFISKKKLLVEKTVVLRGYEFTFIVKKNIVLLPCPTLPR